MVILAASTSEPTRPPLTVAAWKQGPSQWLRRLPCGYTPCHTHTYLSGLRIYNHRHTPDSLWRHFQALCSLSLGTLTLGFTALPPLPCSALQGGGPGAQLVPLIICSRCSQRMSPTKSGASSRKRSLPRLHNTWPFMPNLWRFTFTRLNSLVAQRSHWHTCCSVHSHGSTGEGRRQNTQEHTREQMEEGGKTKVSPMQPYGLPKVHGSSECRAISLPRHWQQCWDRCSADRVEIKWLRWTTSLPLFARRPWPCLRTKSSQATAIQFICLLQHTLRRAGLKSRTYSLECRGGAAPFWSHWR